MVCFGQIVTQNSDLELCLAGWIFNAPITPDLDPFDPAKSGRTTLTLHQENHARLCRFSPIPDFLRLSAPYPSK
jgi:hypothetical protein